jgi:hypothetical protein
LGIGWGWVVSFAPSPPGNESPVPFG